MLSRGKGKKKKKNKKWCQAVPTVVLILFLILPERLNLLISQSEQLPSTAPAFFLFFFPPNGTRSDSHAQAARYDNGDYIQDCFHHVKYLLPIPSCFPGSTLCTEVWGILGGLFQKRPTRWRRNLPWMFLTFLKQVSVIKTYRTLLSMPSSSSPSYLSFFASFYFLSTKNPVIYFAYLNPLIRVSLVFPLSRLWVLSLSIVAVALAVAIRERASTKRDIFL